MNKSLLQLFLILLVSVLLVQGAFALSINYINGVDEVIEGQTISFSISDYCSGCWYQTPSTPLGNFSRSGSTLYYTAPPVNNEVESIDIVVYSDPFDKNDPTASVPIDVYDTLKMYNYGHECLVIDTSYCSDITSAGLIDAQKYGAITTTERIYTSNYLSVVGFVLITDYLNTSGLNVFGDGNFESDLTVVGDFKSSSVEITNGLSAPSGTFSNSLTVTGTIVTLPPDAINDSEVSNALTISASGNVSTNALYCDTNDDDIIDPACIPIDLGEGNIDDIYVLTAGDEMNGTLVIDSGASALNLTPYDKNHVFISFYPNDANTRRAWIGFGSPGTEDLTIKNEFADGKIILQGKVNATQGIYVHGDDGIFIKGASGKTSLEVANGVVKLPDGQIDNSELASNSVNSTKILDGTIVAVDLADSAVTSDKILDGTIINDDLASNSVNSSKILDGTIVADDLADGSVGASELVSAYQLGSAYDYRFVNVSGDSMSGLLYIDDDLNVSGIIRFGDGGLLRDADGGYTAITSNAYRGVDGDGWYYLNDGFASIIEQDITGNMNFFTASLGSKNSQIVWLGEQFSVKNNGSVSIGGVPTGSFMLSVGGQGRFSSGLTVEGSGVNVTFPDGSIDTNELADSAVTSSKIKDGSVSLDDLNKDSVNSTKILDGEVKTIDLADSSVTSDKILDGTVNISDLGADSVGASELVNITGLSVGSYGGSDIVVSKLTVDEDGRITLIVNKTIRSATFSLAGVVQLENSTTSISTSKAATPYSVKTTYDLAKTANTTATGRVRGDGTVGTIQMITTAFASGPGLGAEIGNSKITQDADGNITVAGNLTVLGASLRVISAIGDSRIYADKVDATTFDPVYTINGVSYATYVASLSGGVKEEITGVATLSFDGSSYSYTFDFNDLERGSDLWLFYQATDFGSNFDKLVVMLTPSFNGAVWYEKWSLGNKLVIHGSSAGEVSYRLTANRIDWRDWSNYADGSFKGLIIEEK